MSTPLGKIPFVAAHPSSYRQVPVGRVIELIVIHSMEAPEKGSTAENVANYFARPSGNPPLRPPASAHYNIDNNSIVQSIQTRDVAYGARGSNANGIHLEHAGYARQTTAEWLDEYSKAMLMLSAQLCAEVLVPKYAIPIRFLDAATLKKGHVRGFTTHHEVSKAFNPGGHWDPGPGFPMDWYLEQIKCIRG